MRPRGSRVDATPLLAVAKTILSIACMAEIKVSYTNVLPVPPGPSMKKKPDHRTG